MNTKQTGRPRTHASWWIIAILLAFVALPFVIAVLDRFSDAQTTSSGLAGQLRTLFSMPNFATVALIGTCVLAGLAFVQFISWQVAGLMMLLMAVWPAWLWISEDLRVQDSTIAGVMPTVEIEGLQWETGSQLLLLIAAMVATGILMILIGIALDRRPSGDSHARPTRSRRPVDR